MARTARSIEILLRTTPAVAILGWLLMLSCLAGCGAGGASGSSAGAAFDSAFPTTSGGMAPVSDNGAQPTGTPAASPVPLVDATPETGPSSSPAASTTPTPSPTLTPAVTPSPSPVATSTPAPSPTATPTPLDPFWSLSTRIPNPSPTPAGDRVPLGVNVDHQRDWGRDTIFVDAMKTCRQYGSPDTPWDRSASLDPNDWPTSDFGVVVFSELPNASGTYALSFRGRGTVSSILAGATVQDQLYDAETDTSTASVIVAPSTDPRGQNLMLRFTGTRDGARDIRLIRPGYPADTRQVFTDIYLNRVQPFSTLRFQEFLNMQGNWDNTGNPLIRWDERPLPTTGLQTTNRGAALEYAILLANQTGKDIWVNVPDQANDEYVREMALLLKTRLDPDLRVYVEWSNEVWNWGFAQTRRNDAAARAEGAVACELNDFGATSNTSYWGWRRAARRAMDVSNVFRQAWGDDAMMTRVRPVLCSQFGYYYMVNHQLRWLAQYYGEPGRYLYAIAGAPYWGPGPSVAGRTDLSVDEVLSITSAALDRVSTRFGYDPAYNGQLDWANLPTYNTLARFYNIQSIAYEGGPDTAGANSLGARIAANHDPRMGDLVTRSLQAWYAGGNDLFVYFSLSMADGPHGSFGLYPDITQDTVKARAVVGISDMLRSAP